jgi:zinc/manganese transport system ATP-binding protein
MPIRLSNLTLGYDRHPAVHHLSHVFEDGSLTAILGPNGGGKSTLLKAIAGDIAPLSGQIDLGGLRRKDIAWLPQGNASARDFPIQVLDVVQMGLWPSCGAFRGFGANGASKARTALETVGLQDFANRPIGTLSEGQFRRVLFARLLLQDARVILLDEPFAAVDMRTTDALLPLIHRWHAEGRTVLTVLHDPAQAKAHFPAALLVARDLIASGPTADVLSPENWTRAQTLAGHWQDDASLCNRAGEAAA